MRILLTTFLIATSLSVNAKAISCNSELERYKTPGIGFINICRDNKQEISFRATSFGNRGHTCNARGKASLKGNQYIFKKRSCTISFELKDNKLNATYDNCWRGFCGMDATWNDGTFSK